MSFGGGISGSSFLPFNTGGGGGGADASGGFIGGLTNMLGFGSPHEDQRNAPSASRGDYFPAGANNFPTTATANIPTGSVAGSQQEPAAVPGTNASPILGGMSVSVPSMMPSSGLNPDGTNNRNQGGFRVT